MTVTVNDSEELSRGYDSEPTGFILHLKPIPGWRTSPIQRLRALLKATKRAYGFQATSIKPETKTKP
jgi:hypothetical protein